jgi:hypothetical protein
VRTYRIANWTERYENNRTRELKRLEWFPMPNRMDGDGYTELLDHKDGPLHFAAWVAMLQVASRCGERGTLLRDTKIPHDEASLSRITRIPAKVFEAAFPRLVLIGWLLQDDENTQDAAWCGNVAAGCGTIPQEGAAIPQQSALNGREGNGKKGTEGNGKEMPPLPDGIRTTRMVEAWDRWQQHRRQIKKPLTLVAAEEQIKDLAKWGEPVAHLAITLAMKHGWQGIFPPKPIDLQNAGIGQPVQPDEATTLF